MLHFIALHICCVFYKLNICANRASSKFIGTIFPTAFAHFVSLCDILVILLIFQTFSPGDSAGKESACNAGNPSSIPEWGRSPGEKMATHSSVLAWTIPWTEELGRLQCMGSQRVRHDWVTNTYISHGDLWSVIFWCYYCQNLMTYLRLRLLTFFSQYFLISMYIFYT